MSVMVRRHELSDAEWAVLSRFLPASGVAGRPRSGDRRVLNGIVWKLRTGTSWRDVPERYGSWRTLYTRLEWRRRPTPSPCVGGRAADDGRHETGERRRRRAEECASHSRSTPNAPASHAVGVQLAARVACAGQVRVVIPLVLGTDGAEAVLEAVDQAVGKESATRYPATSCR
ncbi:transposase [Streptomyces noursei]|uniref:transposase n=1 Tax=Streptomyces noursei TaxID=1971 RepID=UPI0009A00D60